jgi:molybdopterin synthase catalytic subunit
VAGEVEVQYFAAARELAGRERERVQLERSPSTVRELLQQLGKQRVALSPVIHRMRLAVNGEIAQADDAVRDGDEIAVLPPVAGGTGGVLLCGLRGAPLLVDEVLAAVRAPGMGAEVLFLGSVRDHADGKPVARLDYEAHASMAEREMSRILHEIAAARPDVRLAALHRIGELAVGDVAVAVAAAAAHRAEAFEACREAIEQIKHRVPIWKKEWAPDGSANWVNLKS